VALFGGNDVIAFDVLDALVAGGIEGFARVLEGLLRAAR
jgi:hypothetical protein